MISITTSQGKTYEIKEFKNIGDHLKILFVNSEGEELVYWIRITNKGRLVMN